MDLALMRSKTAEVADTLKIMAHQERLMVLCQLTEGEKNVGELQAQSTLSQSAFSQHLKVIKDKGLVKVRKESQQVYYSLAEDSTAELINCLHKIFCQ